MIELFAKILMWAFIFGCAVAAFMFPICVAIEWFYGQKREQPK